ncbi:MAG: OmpA family protein [Cyclobacteriaceae bacterium]|nr:OmpA family protein [Cyclobacteriaceae bacterium]
MIRVLSVRAVFLLLLFHGELSWAQPNDLVKVSGRVVSEKDSSRLSATILYEKLPYYDDMGMTRSSLDGSFELLLLKNTRYTFRIDNVSGHQEFEKEFEISDTDGDGFSFMELKVSPDEKEELIRLDNLNFNRGSATILSSSYPSLNEFIEYVNQRPDVLIQLEGHTDFAGNAEANMKLSEARVQAVAEYLISNGVKKARVTTKAFGGTVPITTERTDEAKGLNRRVEVRLIRQN